MSQTERAASHVHKSMPGMKDMSDSEHHAMMIADFRWRFWTSLTLVVPILLLSPSIQSALGLTVALNFPGAFYVLWAFSSMSYFYGGWPFLKGFFSEVRSKSPGMMTLIALAITIAYLYSSAVVFGLKGEVFFWELATLIDVMLLGHWLEMRSIAAASSALEELAKLMPSVAHKVLPDNSMEDVVLSELRVGDRVMIKPGEKVPADGEVVDGETSVNEAVLTGESAPVFKKLAAHVIGGSLNGDGSIIVEVKRTGADSFLSQVSDLVNTAQASKSRTQNLADRAALAGRVPLFGVTKCRTSTDRRAGP
jgi:P-type Cu2+ transporter